MSLAVYTAAACATSSGAQHPIALGNEIYNDIIPQSRIRQPKEMSAQHADKEDRLLRVFKTPRQQFMPLGFYALANDMKNVAVLQRLRRNHINMVHKYSSRQGIPDALEDLSAAGNAGIGVLQNLPKGYLKEGDAFWQKHIDALFENQQIFAWYLPEEVEPIDLTYLASISNVIKKSDAARRPIITYVENYVKGYWEKAAECTDALVFGAYPILLPAHPRATGRRIIDKAYEVGVPVVIKAVEAYTKRGRWTRPKEVRFDTYLSLISGAKGIFWYCYARAHENPELMAEIFKLAAELNGPDRLGEVFLVGEDIENIRCELIKGDRYAPAATAFENRNQKIKRRYAAIQWVAKRYDKAIYIFMVNLNEKIGAPDHGDKDYQVTVRFKSDLFHGVEVQVMHEARFLNVKENSFADTVEPIGTHIYRVLLHGALRR